MKLLTKLFGLTALAAFVALPLLALAQAPLPAEPGAIAQAIISAISGGKWQLVLVLAIVGVVWVLRKFGATLIPFLATSEGGALFALLSGIALYLCAIAYAGQPITGQILITALVTAWAASGGWTTMRRILRLIPWPWLQQILGSDPQPPAAPTPTV